jgi:hypothetical protein
MDVLPNTIYAREAFLPISLSAKDFVTNYVPFVDVTDARNVRSSDRRRFLEIGRLTTFLGNG